jgi:hypothetical protein
MGVKIHDDGYIMLPYTISKNLDIKKNFFDFLRWGLAT